MNNVYFVLTFVNLHTLSIPIGGIGWYSMNICIAVVPPFKSAVLCYCADRNNAWHREVSMYVSDHIDYMYSANLPGTETKQGGAEAP